jgi:uncharacterized protein YcfJ
VIRRSRYARHTDPERGGGPRTCVGCPLGSVVGRSVGVVVGREVGARVGACDGAEVGAVVGACDGACWSYMAGPKQRESSTRHMNDTQTQREGGLPTCVGCPLGSLVGRRVGVLVGRGVGTVVGACEG